MNWDSCGCDAPSTPPYHPGSFHGQTEAPTYAQDDQLVPGGPPPEVPTDQATNAPSRQRRRREHTPWGVYILVAIVVYIVVRG